LTPKAKAAVSVVTLVGADLEMSHRAGSPLSHLERSHSQTRCAFKGKLIGSLESRHILSKWLNPASAPTLEYLKAQIRSKVEHPFHVVKNLFRHKKTRYKGLAKNAAQMFSLFGLANLVIAKKKLLAMQAQGAS
jgi:hypothetical protein